MEPCREVMEGVCTKLIHCGDGVLIRLHKARAGARVPWHHHESWQASIVIAGRLQIEKKGETITAEPGTVTVFQPGEEHAVTIIEDSIVLDINWPLTEQDRKAAESLAGPGVCK